MCVDKSHIVLLLLQIISFLLQQSTEKIAKPSPSTHSSRRRPTHPRVQSWHVCNNRRLLVHCEHIMHIIYYIILLLLLTCACTGCSIITQRINRPRARVKYIYIYIILYVYNIRYILRPCIIYVWFINIARVVHGESTGHDFIICGRRYARRLRSLQQQRQRWRWRRAVQSVKWKTNIRQTKKI